MLYIAFVAFLNSKINAYPLKNISIKKFKKKCRYGCELIEITNTENFTKSCKQTETEDEKFPNCRRLNYGKKRSKYRTDAV